MNKILMHEGTNNTMIRQNTAKHSKTQQNTAKHSKTQQNTITGLSNTTVANLRVTAAMFVYVLHCAIVCSESFGFTFAKPWQFFLKTPAWSGVWIFMILSGFLAGNGFFSGRYELTRKGIMKYYISRFLSVILPTYIFISLVYILVDAKTNITLSVILKFITFTFRGQGGPLGVGASWYVFTVAWLYAFTPLMVKALKKFELKYAGYELRNYIKLFAVLALLGLAYRILGRISGLDWGDWIYSGVPGNMDLFAGGVIIGRIKFFLNNRNLNKAKIYAVVVFVVLVVMNEFMYLYGEYEHKIFLYIYRYILPTCYLFVLSVLLCASSEKTELNKFETCMNTLAKLSFQFYLWHSLIMHNLAARIYFADSFMCYLVVLFAGFVVTGYVAYLMTLMQENLILKLRS